MHTTAHRRDDPALYPGRTDVILSIQYLRGIAALLVAIHHVGNHAGISFEVGAAGVDLFFVISGFIMWTVTSERQPGPGPFLADRITRIAPPYILLTILTYVVARTIPAIFPNMRTDLTHVVLSVLFIPHVDPQGTRFPQIVSGWTLNYEMFFYVVFAAMLLVPKRVRAGAATAVLVLLPTAGLLIGSSSPVAAAYTSPLLLEFLGGIWLGVAWRAEWRPRLGFGVASLAAGMAGFTAWQLLLGTDPGPWRALAWGVPAWLVVGGALATERCITFPRAWLPLLTGNASYSIYLVNAFTTAAAWRMMRTTPLPIYYLVGIALSLTGGIVFWYMVERPVTRLIRQWFRRPVPITEPVPDAAPSAP